MPERVNICCGHATCQKLVQEAIDTEVQFLQQKILRLESGLDTIYEIALRGKQQKEI